MHMDGSDELSDSNFPRSGVLSSERPCDCGSCTFCAYRSQSTIRARDYCYAQRRTGELVWLSHQRRARCLFDVARGVIVATTDEYSGVYALSFETGKKIWSRLGDRFDWLLKLFEYLPCDNEGDGPFRIQDDQILTRGGCLLDRSSGTILSRNHCFDLRKGDFQKPRFRYGGIPSETEDPDAIDRILALEGLETSERYNCLIQKRDRAFVIACEPPSQHRDPARSRLNAPVKPTDVAHYLIVIRHADNAIVHREKLGLYYHAEIAWADEATLAIAVRNKKQWYWSDRRDLRVYDVSRV